MTLLSRLIFLLFFAMNFNFNFNFRINLNQWPIPQCEQEFKRRPCQFIRLPKLPLHYHVTAQKKKKFQRGSTFFHSIFHVK